MIGSIIAYVLAVLLPPAAAALHGRLIATLATLLLCLTLVGWPVASLIAVVSVRGARRQQQVRVVYRPA